MSCRVEILPLPPDHIQIQVGTEQAFGRTRTYCDLGVHIDCATLQAMYLFRDCFSQCRDARHRRILVGTVVEVIANALRESRWWIEAWEALRQVDRTVLPGEAGHLPDDRFGELERFGGDSRQGIPRKHRAGEAGASSRALLSMSSRGATVPHRLRM